MAITLNETKEYLRVGYDEDNQYIAELIEISEDYIDSCVGTAYKKRESYEAEEDYKKGQRIAALLQKKIVNDMYEDRGTTISDNVKQSNITRTILDKLSNVGA